MPTNRELAKQYSQHEAEQLAAQLGSAPQASSTAAAPAAGVVGDAHRPVPGASAGGLTPEQAAAALSGGAAGLGLQPATARVLAAHEVAVPQGTPNAPGGTFDLTLDVSLSAGAGYSTRMRVSFSTPEKAAAIARVGRDLPVLVNPSAPDQVAIDTARLI
ncbi:hypothetical protein [Glaciihabitans sp. UYNi722]|uniref:hypothetical protein n=1 Tax=Glaciihabitans sp. UYNi722 TaxID=3156344 RepID=UPI003399DC74